jgi:hypothetical protein
MDSTLQLRVDDPHDAAAIAPDIIPAAWADKVLADIARDAKSPAEAKSPADVGSPADVRSPARDQQPPSASGSASVVAPTVDTPTVDTPTVDTKAFRAPPTGEINVAPERPVDVPSRGSRMKSFVTVFLFALCSALAAAAWQHYGAQARQMIANWAPPFALVASPAPATTAAAQPDAPAVQASATDQTPVQTAAPVQPQDGAAPAATAPAATVPSPDTTQLMQSMARDVADLRQQIVELKGNIAELKAGQQTLARDVAKPSEPRPSELRTSIQAPRPRASVPPPRPAAALSRRPAPAYYAPAQTAYVPPMPQAAPPAMPPQPAPPAAADPDGDPVVRPPMPLR